MPFSPSSSHRALRSIGETTNTRYTYIRTNLHFLQPLTYTLPLNPGRDLGSNTLFAPESTRRCAAAVQLVGDNRLPFACLSDHSRPRDLDCLNNSTTSNTTTSFLPQADCDESRRSIQVRRKRLCSDSNTQPGLTSKHSTPNTIHLTLID